VIVELLVANSDEYFYASAELLFVDSIQLHTHWMDWIL